MTDSILDSGFGSTFSAELDEIGMGGINLPSKKEEIKETKKDQKKENKIESKPINIGQNNNSSSKNSKNDAPVRKRRPKMAPKMGLVDLTSLLPSSTVPKSAQPVHNYNNDLNDFLSSDKHPTPVQQKPIQPSFYPSQISLIENRLTSYLETSLNRLALEFTQDLPNLFLEKDVLSPMADNLINDLQKEIRNIISFTVDQPQNTYNFVANSFDSYASFYKDIFVDAERAKGHDYTGKARTIHSARVETQTAASKFKNQCTDMMEDFVTISNDNNLVKRSNFNSKRRFMKKMADYQEQILDLEEKNVELKGREKSLRRKAKKLEMEQEEKENSNENFQEDFLKNLQDALDAIKSDNAFQNLDLIRNIQRIGYQTDVMLQDVDTLRQAKIYQMQGFNDNVYASQTVTYTYNTFRPQLPNESSIQEDESSDLSFEASFHAPSPNNELKKKFRNISKKRREQLKNATDFMDNIRRNERKKTRKIVTDISVLSST